MCDYYYSWEMSELNPSEPFSNLTSEKFNVIKYNKEI